MRSSVTRARRPPAASTRQSRLPQRSMTGAGRSRAVSRRRWLLPLALAAAALVVVVVVVVLANQGGGAAASGAYVGGDLHTLTVAGDRLYVGGHDGVAASTDGGRQWRPVSSLRGADAMGWAQTTEALLVGGHQGLYRSGDTGASFALESGSGQVADVHALGAAGDTVYLASPRAGLLASSDGGRSWQTRNTDAGRGFMGTILVDPADPAHLIAPDMQSGLVASADGGRSWTQLGGPGGTMAAAWDPTDNRRLVVVGMAGASSSSDGGQTWTSLSAPRGTSAVAYSADGRTLYAATLDGDTARVYASPDAGRSWVAP